MAAVSQTQSNRSMISDQQLSSTWFQEMTCSALVGGTQRSLGSGELYRDCRQGSFNNKVPSGSGSTRRFAQPQVVREVTATRAREFREKALAKAGNIEGNIVGLHGQSSWLWSQIQRQRCAVALADHTLDRASLSHGGLIVLFAPRCGSPGSPCDRHLPGFSVSSHADLPNHSALSARRACGWWLEVLPFGLDPPQLQSPTRLGRCDRVHWLVLARTAHTHASLFVCSLHQSFKSGAEFALVDVSCGCSRKSINHNSYKCTDDVPQTAHCQLRSWNSFPLHSTSKTPQTAQDCVGVVTAKGKLASPHRLGRLCPWRKLAAISENAARSRRSLRHSAHWSKVWPKHSAAAPCNCQTRDAASQSAATSNR